MNVKKKNQEIAFQGPQRIVAGTGAGRQTLFPGEWGVEKRPGIPHGIPKYVIESQVIDYKRSRKQIDVEQMTCNEVMECKRSGG